MDDFIKQMRLLSTSKSEQSDLMAALSKIQVEICHKNLSSYDDESISRVLEEIWKFLLFNGSSNNSSIRLLAYKATGSFLLRIYPFYPKLLQNSFSQVSMNSTIDLKSSAILASSFAFISNKIPKSELPEFLNSTPIFHHFTFSDQIFSEHLPKIISKLHNVGISWMRTLLFSYLELVQKSKERYVYKSISAVISHYPNELMTETVEYLTNTNTISAQLSLLSFLICSLPITMNTESTNTIIDNAFSCLSMPSQPDKDSALVIISLKCQDLKVTLINVDTLELVHNNRFLKLSINELKEKPSLYQLPLPLSVLRPHDDDSVFITSAKMQTLAKYYMIYSNGEDVLDIFQEYADRPYNEYTSALINGVVSLSKSMPYNQRLSDLVLSIIFKKSNSWFHSNDILRLIKTFSYDKALQFLGLKEVNRIIMLLVSFSINQNKGLSQESKQALIMFIPTYRAQDILRTIIAQVDVFNDFSLNHYLELIVLLVELAPNIDNVLIDSINCIFIELFGYKSTEIEFLEAFFSILSKQKTYLVEPKLRGIITYASSIAALSIINVTGHQWDYPIDLSPANVIKDDYSTKNCDIVSGSDLEYSRYYSLVYSIIRLALAMPLDYFNIKFIKLFIFRILKIFPLESAMLAQKYWGKFSTAQKTIFLNKAAAVSINHDCTAIHSILCRLLLKHQDDSLTTAYETLFEIAKRSIDCHESLDTDSLAGFLLFFFYDDQESIYSFLKNMNNERMQSVLQYLSEYEPNKYNSSVKYLETSNNRVESKKYEFQNPSEEEVHRLDFIYSLRFHSKLYTMEELKQKINISIENNDQILYNSVFSYCEEMHFQINIQDYQIPEQWVKYSQENMKNEADMNLYLLNLYKSDKISHNDMVQFSISLNSTFYNTDLLFAFSLRCMEISHSTKKTHVATIIACQVALLYPSLSKDYIAALLHVLSAKNESNCIKSFACLLKLISSRFEFNQEFYQFLMKLLNESGFRSISSSIILSIIISKFPGGYDSKQLVKNIEWLASIESPSHLLHLIDTIQCCMLSLADNISITILHDFLSVILNLYLPYARIPYVNDSLSLFLTFIISKKSYSSEHAAIIKFQSRIIPNKDRASLLSFSSLISSIIASGNASKEVIMICDSLLVSPISYSLFKLYMMTLKERSERIDDIDEKADFLSLAITTWLWRGEQNDCYSLAEIIYEWETLIFLYLGMESYRSLVISQFPKYIPRFFPYYYAVSRFVSKFAKTLDKDQYKSLSDSIMLNSKKVITDSHRSAFSKLLDKAFRLEGLNLSSTPKTIC